MLRPLIRYLLFFSFVWGMPSFQATAQAYHYIIHIQGECSSQGLPLAVGGNVQLNQSIFLGQYAQVFLIDAYGKRMKLMAPTQAGGNFKVEDCLHKASEAYHQPRCPEEKITSLLAFNCLFQKQSMAVLGEELYVRISSKLFPMNESAFFYLAYHYQGEEIAKMLPFTGDTLWLIRDLIYQIDGVAIDPNKSENHQIWYYDSQREESYYGIECQLSMPSNRQVLKEVGMMMKVWRDNHLNEMDIFYETAHYITEAYAIPRSYNLKQWLQVNFGLRFD